MRNGPEDATAAGRELLAPLGTLVALSLPFFVLALGSAQATRDAKLAAQAAGAVLVLLGLAYGSPSATREPAGRGARLALVAFPVFLALLAASATAGVLGGRDPLDLLPVLPALALFAWGSTRPGEASAGRALALLVACGALTGLLAALQRFAGLFRLPVQAPEPRFFATALIGNPGDVGAALVVPALLAAASLARGERRLASALAFAALLAGLAAAATLAPIAAFGAGAAVLVLADLRRRLLPALGAGLVLLGLLQAGGVLSRVSEKLAAGEVGALTTQRDIGVLAALETVRAHPVLGVGPGGFSADFVRARLAAEERAGRRLVHRSASAHFDNAHNDPLTVAAEAGVPAAVALAFVLAALLVPLVAATRRERAGKRPGGLPAEALLASLAAVLVLSLANFPIQIVPVSGPFALLAGLALARGGGSVPLPSGRAGRTALALLALLLATGAAVRLAGGRALARAETALRLVPGASGEGRSALVASALADARRAVALRPRSATAHLALGTARAAGADPAGAVASMERSRELEERAETLLNLGRLAIARGDDHAARPFFLRAVWVFPRLAAAIPPAGDPEGVVAEVARLEAALAAGGAPPPAPPPLRLR
ncbi:MAG TPA: O-antigen ligase family protein [Thermoanaerobaculia bacterium]|nr:O-antigen ligase family protein [Thermoanaerobaculia bacterium]HQN07624.1 O-antigen ligase family protein [Thermoanaerobaculia bacterium]HQP84650.1 O-antigen ligase family protein [Thermoanaerobaculia bacterium]